VSRRAYVDASALVKLVLSEPESEALSRHLQAFDSALTSRIATIEVPRAVQRVVEVTPAHEAAMAAVWEAATIIELDASLAGEASRIGPAALRTLDAIHLATALAVGDELDEVITYDARLADAARAHGLTVVAPA
jgi:predicted nucleic acid-binding protein